MPWSWTGVANVSVSPLCTTQRARSLKTYGWTNRSTYNTPGTRASNGSAPLSTSTRTPPEPPPEYLICVPPRIEAARTISGTRDVSKAVITREMRVPVPDDGVVGEVLEDRHAGRREHPFHRGRDGSVELNDVVELLVPGDRVVPEGSGNRRGLRERIELEIIDRDIFHVVRDRPRHDRRRRGPRRRPQNQERREDHHEHQRDCDDTTPHAARHCVR